MLIIRLMHLKAMPSFEDLVSKSISSQTEEIATTEKTTKRIADIVVMIIKAGIIANDSLTKNPTNVQKSICMFLTLTS